MSPASEPLELRTDSEHAIEIQPGRWLDDDEIIALEQRYDILLIERFADGTLLVTPPSGWTSAASNAGLTAQVFNWVSGGDQGIALDSSGGVHLPDGALLAPDTTFISTARLAQMPRERTFAHVVPDAAFEVLSTSDRIRTTLKKIDTYLRNGVLLVVLIDPQRRRVYAGRAEDAGPRELGNVTSIDCSPVMPGFVLDVLAVYGGNRASSR